MTTIADLEAVIAQQATIIQQLNASLTTLQTEVQQMQAAAPAPGLQQNAPNARKPNFQFGKELCPDCFSGDGNDKTAFRGWAAKCAVYLSIDNDHAMEIMKWSSSKTENITSDEYRDEAADKSWTGSSGRDHIAFNAYLYSFLFLKTSGTANKIVNNGTMGAGVNAWRRLVGYYDPKLMAKSQHYLRLSLKIGRAKGVEDTKGKLQTFEECVKNYEDAKGQSYDSELKINRLLDILPEDVEKHLLLENRNQVMTYEDLYRRATTYITALTPMPKNSNDMDIGGLMNDNANENQPNTE